MKAKQYTAEFIGTFALVFAGCGAIVINHTHGGVIGHQGISLVFGLIVMAMIYSIGNISGAHINPAVSIAFTLSGRFDKKMLLPYIFSQCIGALTACLVLKLMFPEHDTLGSTLPSGSITQSFIMEFILSFLLMFVIFNISTGHMEKGIMAGVAVGGTVALEAMLGGPVCGASMNPARSIGPALISGNLEHLWLYIVAPISGMLLAYPCCCLSQEGDCCGPTDESEQTEKKSCC